jgi:two-component system cell cycle response regulator CtrA
MGITCKECGQPIPSADGVVVDGSRGVVSYAGKSVHLAADEFALFALLVRRTGRALSKETIYDHLYAHRPDCDQPDIKIVDVYVCKVRRKLAQLFAPADPEEFIKTHWGRGYEFVPPGKGSRAAFDGDVVGVGDLSYGMRT